MQKEIRIDPRTAPEIENAKAMHNPETKGEQAEGSFDFTLQAQCKRQ